MAEPLPPIDTSFTIASWSRSGLPLIDCRETEHFNERHLKGATTVPIQTLMCQARELPPKNASICLYVSTPVLEQHPLESIVSSLESRKYPVVHVFIETEELWRTAEELGLIETGPHSKLLWKPSPVLEGVIEEIEQLRMESGLDRTGHAIDLASGNCRDGVFLALRGWSADNYDLISDHLEKGVAMSKRYGLDSLLRIELLDIVKERDKLLARGQCDLLNISRYLDRSQFEFQKSLVRPGGFIAFHTFMEGCEKPRRDAFKLKNGELAEVFGDEFDTLHDEVIKISDGRPTSYFLARKKFDTGETQKKRVLPVDEEQLGARKKLKIDSEL